MTTADPPLHQGPIVTFAKSDAGLVVTRGAVVVAPVVLALVGWLVTHYLDGAFQHETDQISSVSSRVSAIESSSTAAADKAGAVAKDLSATQQALKDEQAQASMFRTDTAAKLDKQSDTLTSVETTLAGISARIDSWHRQGQP